MNRRILKLAVPSIVANITVPLLGMIDVAITGHLGNEAFIGAIAVGGMLFNIIYWLFGFLRMGTSGMTAQGRGARRFGEVLALLRQSLTVAVGIAIALIVLQWPVRELALWIISPTEDVARLTRTYFNICIWGAIPSLSLFALMGWFIGMQNTRIPMFISILQNVLNIVCSLCFVYCLGMKIEGVALGTVMAQWGGFIIALWMCYHFYYRRLTKISHRNVLFKLHRTFLKERLFSFITNPGLKPCATHRTSLRDFILINRKFFLVNRDIFLRTCCLVAVHFFFIYAGAKHGTVALAVNTLIMQLFTLYSYFLDGFAFAGEALAGKAIGAGNQGELRRVVRRLFVWGGAMALVFSVIYAVWGRGVLSLFTDQAEVLRAADEYWMWIILFPAAGMAAFIWDGIFCGATATRGMLVSIFLSMAVFFTLYWLLSPMLGNNALWLAFIVYLALRGVIQTFLFVFSNNYC